MRAPEDEQAALLQERLLAADDLKAPVKRIQIFRDRVMVELAPSVSSL